MTNLKTQEQLRNLMTGIEPIRRTNRRAGESEYYFLRPVADSEYDDEQIDVPDGVDSIAFRDAGYQVPTTSGFGTSGFGSSSGQQSGFGLNAYNAGMSTTTDWPSTSQSTGTSVTNTGFGINNTFGSGTGLGSSGFGDSTNTGSGFGTTGFGSSTSPYSTTPPTNYGGTYDYGADYGITTPTTQSDDSNNQALLNAQSFLNREQNWKDKLSEFMSTNQTARLIGMGLQGIANAGTNPFGYIARSAGLDTKPLQAENWLERGVEAGSQAAYNMGTMSAIGTGIASAGLLGQGQNILSKTAQTLLNPETVPAVTAAFGSGAAIGAVEPETTAGTIGTGFAGGLLAGAAPSMAKSLSKPIASSVTNGFKQKNITPLVPTKNQLSYTPDSSFNPNRYTKLEGENVLRQRANRQRINIFNDELSHLNNEDKGVNHFLRSDRRPFVRTLNNTVNKPDISFERGKREYLVKKYKNSRTGKDFFDFIIKQDGELFDKFLVKQRYLLGQLNNPTQNLSLRGVRPGIFEPISGMNGLKTHNISPINSFVNPNSVLGTTFPTMDALYNYWE